MTEKSEPVLTHYLTLADFNYDNNLIEAGFTLFDMAHETLKAWHLVQDTSISSKNQEVPSKTWPSLIALKIRIQTWQDTVTIHAGPILQAFVAS